MNSDNQNHAGNGEAGGARGKIITAYVVGPFTAPTDWTRAQNVNAAEAFSLGLMEHCEGRVLAVCPHANSRLAHGHMTAEFWYAATIALMDQCDCVVTMPNWRQSPGGLREVARARARGQPVFAHEPETEAPRHPADGYRAACHDVYSRVTQFAQGLGAMPMRGCHALGASTPSGGQRDYSSLNTWAARQP